MPAFYEHPLGAILKNGRARAIRFSTLTRLCEVLDCQPGDLLTWHKQRG